MCGVVVPLISTASFFMDFFFSLMYGFQPFLQENNIKKRLNFEFTNDKKKRPFLLTIFLFFSHPFLLLYFANTKKTLTNCFLTPKILSSRPPHLSHFTFPSTLSFLALSYSPHFLSLLQCLVRVPPPRRFYKKQFS